MRLPVMVVRLGIGGPLAERPIAGLERRPVEVHSEQMPWASPRLQPMIHDGEEVVLAVHDRIPTIVAGKFRELGWRTVSVEPNEVSGTVKLLEDKGHGVDLDHLDRELWCRDPRKVEIRYFVEPSVGELDAARRELALRWERDAALYAAARGAALTPPP